VNSRVTFIHRFTNPAPTDISDKNWTWQNYLNARALAQATNVRAQIQRIMERFEIDLVSTEDMRKFYVNIRQALVCGYFMQVAHKEGEKGSYLTVLDNQVCMKFTLRTRDIA
jgi:pre-mRNA-splicing factor ATP-dependent RNA helicase DHX15/PRP43